MAQIKGRLTEEIPRHRILREVYRHYLEYRSIVMSPRSESDGSGKTSNSAFCDNGVIEHGYFIYNEDGSIKDRIIVTISFWDLFNGLKDLSPRKREAVWYNVILDQKQRDVAEKMKITTVSVGQYVEQAMLQLSERYFAEENGHVRKESEDTKPNEEECTGTNQKKPLSTKRAKTTQTIS